jgi:N-methylhydantoinase B
MNETPDPTSLEVSRNALEGIADTMAITLYRTARSAVVRLGWDFSTAVMAPNGDTIGQGMCHPIHLGGMMPALAGCLKHYGNSLEPEDILISNDPYEGAQHLPDTYLFKPVFRGDDLVGFAAATCHQSDIGGRVPGGQGYDNVEIYQEGLRIPPLKLYERGEPNETIFRLIEKAVRTPDQVLGDLTAEVTAINVGEREILSFVERLGTKNYLAMTRHLVDYTERLTRQRIATLPDGSWSFTDVIDDDGITADPIMICARVTKKGDQLQVDFDGTSPQCRGSITGLLHMSANFVQMALRCLLGADIPNTAGFFRPITITAPPGSFVNPLAPAAVGARQLGGRRINQAVWGALAQMVPNRVFACPGGADASMATSGTDRSRNPWREWVLTEGFNEIACGGRSDKDGMDGQGSNISNQANTPIEILEKEYPIKITEYGFVPDSEGAGKFRGGLAMVRTFEYLDADIQVRTRSDRAKRPPWGLFGGGAAAPPSVRLTHNGIESVLPGKSTLTVSPGDRIRTQWCGGGGYGNPLERDPEKVLWDVIEGKVSLSRARAVYGVVIDEPRRTVDTEATNLMRSELRHHNS